MRRVDPCCSVSGECDASRAGVGFGSDGSGSGVMLGLELRRKQGSSGSSGGSGSGGGSSGRPFGGDNAGDERGVRYGGNCGGDSRGDSGSCGHRRCVQAEEEEGRRQGRRPGELRRGDLLGRRQAAQVVFLSRGIA